MAEFTLQIDDKGLKFGFVDFEKANTIAVRNTLNIQAAISRRNYLKNVQEDFTLRNTFTKRSIQFDKAEELSISQMESRTGSKADYMVMQEEGGVKKPKSGNRLAIGEKGARGGSNQSVIAKSLYLRKMKNNSVKGSFKKNYKSRKARSVARMAVGFNKKKFLKKADGIYMISSFKSRNGRIRARMTRIYNLKKRSVKIKPTHALERAIEKPVIDGPNIHKSQIKKLFKGPII